MQTPYKPRHPKDRIYAHGSNPVPGFNTLDIGSSRPGGPTKDAPMYIGMVFIRKTVTGYSTPSWEKHEMPETQEALERRVSKYRDKSVDYDHRDMYGAGKQGEVDRFIQRENNKYPGYEYKLRLLLLKEGINYRQKKICKQMTIILQRQPAFKAKPKSQSEDPKQDLRSPFSGPPIKKHTFPSYGDDSFGHRNEDLIGDPAITGIQHQPHDQHNRSQNMPIHDPDHYPPPPAPPQHYIPGAQFQSSPHAHPENDPQFQMPHHEGERFDGPAQHNRFSEPYLKNAGPPQVSFEDQHNHGGLGHHPNTQGSHHTSRPRSGEGPHPIIQEVDPRLHSGLGHPNLQDEFNPRPRSGAGHHANMQGENNNPRPRSGAGHNPIIQEFDPRLQSGVVHPNFQDEYNPRPRSGAGHHLNMHGETNNPGPVNREGGHFDSRDHHQAHPHGGAGDRFDSRDHPQAHPHGGAEQRFDVNEESLNRPRGGVGSHLENFQGNQHHLPAQSKKGNKRGDARGGVYGAGRTPERKANRDSGFFSGGSSDGGSYRNDENIPNAYAESRGKYPYSRDYQDGHQKDNYQSRDRSNDRDSDSNRKYRNYHPREQFNNNSHRTGSHHSLGSAHDHYESDYNGRNASHNKNRQHRRNSSRMMEEGYGDIYSNGYHTPGDDSSDWSSETDSFQSRRGLGSPQTFRRSRRMSHVRIDPKDRLDILDEHDQEWKRREAKKLREDRQRQAELRKDREREETRNGRGGKGRRSSGGTLPRPKLTTHRRYH